MQPLRCEFGRRGTENGLPEKEQTVANDLYFFAVLRGSSECGNEFLLKKRFVVLESPAFQVIEWESNKDLFNRDT